MTYGFIKMHLPTEQWRHFASDESIRPLHRQAYRIDQKNITEISKNALVWPTRECESARQCMVSRTAWSSAKTGRGTALAFDRVKSDSHYNVVSFTQRLSYRLEPDRARLSLPCLVIDERTWYPQIGFPRGPDLERVPRGRIPDGPPWRVKPRVEDPSLAFAAASS